VVRVSGDIDLTTHEQLAEQLAKAAEAGGPVVVDLSSCEFIDSSGIRALLRGLKATEENDRSASFSIAAPAAQVSRVLELTGVNETITLYESVDEALKKT